MNTKPIQRQDELTAEPARVEQFWGAKIGSSEGSELETLVLLIENYESDAFTAPASGSIG